MQDVKFIIIDTNNKDVDSIVDQYISDYFRLNGPVYDTKEQASRHVRSGEKVVKVTLTIEDV